MAKRYEVELGEAPPPTPPPEDRDVTPPPHKGKKEYPGEVPPSPKAEPKRGHEGPPSEVFKKQKKEREERLARPKIELTERAKAILATGKSEREQYFLSKRQQRKGPSLKTRPDLSSGSQRLETARRRAELTQPHAKRFSKSFVPGWLTKEDWPHLTTAEKAAYIAGDIGQTILYLVPVAGVVRAAYLSRPATSTVGTFGKVSIPKGSQFKKVELPSGRIIKPTVYKDVELPSGTVIKAPTQVVKVKTPGLRPMTRNELNSQLKRMGSKKDYPEVKLPSGKIIPATTKVKQPKFVPDAVVKAKDLKKTTSVMLDKKWPIKRDTIFIVKEGPANKLEVRAAKLRYDLMGDRPPPGTPLKGPKATPKMPKGGGAKPAPRSTSTMTPEQLARELGIDPVTIGRPVIMPIPVIRPGPGRTPSPVKPPRPAKDPTPRPAQEPYTGPMPHPAPTPKPSPVPEDKPGSKPGPKPGPGPGPGSGPAAGPAAGPGPRPASVPGPQPQPQPQPKPDPEPPPVEKKPPPKVPPTPEGRPPVGRGLLLPRPSPSAPDEEKRKYLQKVQGFVARRRGALRGKSLWRVNFYPYGKGDEFIVIGPAPKGAKLATGKGSVSRSATLLKGVPPKKPIYSDTGAIDDVITAKGRQIIITSVQDKNIATRHALEK